MNNCFFNAVPFENSYYFSSGQAWMRCIARVTCLVCHKVNRNSFIGTTNKLGRQRKNKRLKPGLYFERNLRTPIYGVVIVQMPSISTPTTRRLLR